MQCSLLNIRMQHSRPPWAGRAQVLHPLHRCGARQRSERRSCSVQASSIRKLPIFPLGMVAFPKAQVPLTIFEARYRVLFSTLLAGAEGIDEELVQETSEFRASRQFGMTYCTPTGGVADVGTILKIVGYSPLEDGRLLITTKGTQRFRILKVLEQRPVLIAECEILDEKSEEEDSVEAHELMEEVTERFRAVWALSNKIRRQPPDAVPSDLGQMAPKALSFWIASMFGDSQPVQQLLLQEDSIITRLRSLSDILDKHVSYLRAAVALESLGTTTANPEPSSETAEGEKAGDAQKDQPPSDDDATSQKPSS